MGKASEQSMGSNVSNSVGLVIPHLTGPRCDFGTEASTAGKVTAKNPTLAKKYALPTEIVGNPAARIQIRSRAKRASRHH